ncbi:hypothetical protein C8F01DRAFT_1185350 [Mycena amicta]|nr:hypothetical protein C8F01DRAFT_1185350 [Mycena amicta]
MAIAVKERLTCVPSLLFCLFNVALGGPHSCRVVRYHRNKLKWSDDLHAVSRPRRWISSRRWPARQAIPALSSGIGRKGL